jgi:type I restriction enzyme R subunit
VSSNALDSSRRRPLRYAVLASGGGSNFQALLDHLDTGIVSEKLTEVVFVASNKNGAQVLERAKKRSIPAYHISAKTEGSEEDVGKRLLTLLDEHKPDEAIPAIKTYFKAYVTSGQIRDIIDRRHFTDLATNPVFSTGDFKAVPEKYRTLVPEYVKDYVSLNQFAA